MHQNLTLLSAGGDERFASLTGMLAENPTHTVYSIGFGTRLRETPGVRCLDQLSQLQQQPDLLILPMPLSEDGVHLKAPCHPGTPILLRYLLDLCHRGTLVFHGKGDQSFKAACEERGLIPIDYLDDEAFTVKNAAATAQAALTLAAELLPMAFFDCEVMVLGGGRIARVLCRLLTAYGASVTCLARSPEQRVWASLTGASALPLTHIGAAPPPQLVFSTIPSMVLGEQELMLLPPDCLMIELASRPGGIDPHAAHRLGRRLVQAPSLPGRTVPVSAARWLCQLIAQKEADYFHE